MGSTSLVCRHKQPFSFVFALDKSLTTSLRVNNRGNPHPLLVLQIRCMEGENTHLELMIASNDALKRRLHISTAFRSQEGHEIHAQVPMILSNKDTWKTVVINVAELVRSLFRVPFKGIETVTLRPVCRIRRIFTLPSASDFTIPPSLDFPSSGQNVDYSPVFIPPNEFLPSAFKAAPQETIDALILGSGREPMDVNTDYPPPPPDKQSYASKADIDGVASVVKRKNDLLKRLRCIERLLLEAKSNHAREFSRLSIRTDF